MFESGECRVVEQVFSDLASGLTFQFETAPNGEARLHVFGESLPFGNRTFEFGPDGMFAGAGTAPNGPTRPTFRINL